MERPIIFSTPMVQAILAGHKHMTRRVIKPQPTPSSIGGWRWIHREVACGWSDSPHPAMLAACPYGRPGDTLWVKETYGFTTGNGKRTVYRADGDPPIGLDGSPVNNMKRGSSRFMRKEYARIWLRITAVRAERLQAISKEEVLAEGVTPLNDEQAGLSYQEAFADLWNNLHRHDGASWEANLWLWVLSFERQTASAQMSIPLPHSSTSEAP